MKELVPIMLSVFALAGCTASPSCGAFDPSCNDSESLILPGKDRIWWYRSFKDYDDVSDFLIKLKKAGKNGDFNVGLSALDAAAIGVEEDFLY